MKKASTRASKEAAKTEEGKGVEPSKAPEPKRLSQGEMRGLEKAQNSVMQAEMEEELQRKEVMVLKLRLENFKMIMKDMERGINDAEEKAKACRRTYESQVLNLENYANELKVKHSLSGGALKYHPLTGQIVE